MGNFILLSVTREGGNAVNYSQLFDPAKMRKVRLNDAQTGITFLYEDNSSYESTSVSTLSGLQGLINLSAPSGTQTYIGVFDPSANTGQRAIAAHDLLDSNGNALVLPANTRVYEVGMLTVTTFVSATDAGTISLGIATNDVAGIKAAVAISSGTTYDAAAPKALIQDGTITNISEKTTASRAVQATVRVYNHT